MTPFATCYACRAYVLKTRQVAITAVPASWARLTDRRFDCRDTGSFPADPLDAGPLVQMVVRKQSVGAGIAKFLVGEQNCAGFNTEFVATWVAPLHSREAKTLEI